MKRAIFILGGVRSGKSSYAIELAKGLGENVVFIATCVHPDLEMKERIKMHKRKRPGHWGLIEEGKDLTSVIDKLKNGYEVIVIDCIGLWLSNLLGENFKNREIEGMIKGLVKGISKIKTNIIVVSNEVGCGIVPDNPLARRFIDLLGFANQMLAKEACEVILMQGGIPIKIKNAKIK